MSRLRLVPLVLALSAAACGSIEVRKTTNALDFLYPEGTPAIAPSDVAIQVPVRVALAFAPESDGPVRSGVSRGGFGRPDGISLTEVQRTALMERLADALRAKDFVEGVDVIPSSYLKPDGSFANLDQLARAFGSDVAVLLSYDQAQFSNTTGWSVTYWTVLGAWVVEGEENQTQTFLDAVVFDIPSRTLLFRAAGTSTLGSEATPVDTPRALQEQSRAGFEEATGRLIGSLDAALGEFGTMAARGTVRGAGTPAIEVSKTAEYSGVAEFENGRYVGALGAETLLAALLLLVAGRRSLR